MKTTRYTLAVVLAVVAFMTAGTTRADTLTYTASATVSGVLDGTVFTNSLVTLALTGDTANIFTVPGVTPLAFQINGTASVSVSGVGSDTFSDVIAVYSFNSTAGFTDVSLGNVGIFGDGSSPFVSFDLSTQLVLL